jgi:serine/threonine protein kinase
VVRIAQRGGDRTPAADRADDRVEHRGRHGTERPGVRVLGVDDVGPSDHRGLCLLRVADAYEKLHERCITCRYSNNQITAVALKFLPDGVMAGDGPLQRFHNELRVARQVSHRNVCRVYDLGEANGRRFLTMEYVDGEDLASLLRRIGRVPQDKAVEIARQLCAGVAAAHDRGVLHRDLKPANVMIDGDGNVRIADFGISTAMDAVDEGYATLALLVAFTLFAFYASRAGRPLFATALTDLPAR